MALSAVMYTFVWCRLCHGFTWHTLLAAVSTSTVPAHRCHACGTLSIGRVG